MTCSLLLSSSDSSWGLVRDTGEAGGKRVENVDDVLSVGQKILVKITKIDDRGKLSLEPVLDDAPAADAAPAEDAAAE